MKNYQIKHNGRGKPFETAEWDTIKHIVTLNPDEIVKVWVYPPYTIIHTKAANYTVQPDGTYDRKTWLE